MSRLTIEMHPLLSEPIIKALYAKNIYTIVNFVTGEIKHISTITNLSYKEVLTVQRYLINKYSAVVHNGSGYYTEVFQNMAVVATGIKNLDELLEGGLLTGYVYEVCGLPASGKTQFCLTLTKNVVQYLNLCVYYIDTKRDFSGRKIKWMLDAGNTSEVKAGEIMSKILVKTIYSHYNLINSLYEIQDELRNGLKLRLIIIDSLPPLFYHSSNSTETNGIMNHFVNIMHLMAKEYHLVFIVVNLITTWYEGDFFVEKSFTEILGLGKYWRTVPNVRLMIKQCPDSHEKYEFVIMKSSKFPKRRNCTVNIGDMGVF